MRIDTRERGSGCRGPIGLDEPEPLWGAIYGSVAARTKAALQAKKAAGARLRNPTKLVEASKAGAGANKREADAFAANVLPVIASLKASGITSHHSIAVALNERRIETARGGVWTAVQVGRIMSRAA
jgi:hypothetical protein